MPKPTTNHFDYLEFPAATVEALIHTKGFYASVFGWTYQDWGDDYADTKDSGLASGITADQAHRPKHPLAVIYTDDLEAARARVIEAGGTVTKDIFPFPGGRRFHFTDPTGNELAVWSDR